MRHMFRKSRVAALVGVVAVVSAATMALVAPAAFGDSPSDTRADFHGGNATNCGSGKNGIGVGGTLAFANGTDPSPPARAGSVVDGTTVNIDDPWRRHDPRGRREGRHGYNIYSTLSSVGADRGNHVPPTEPLPTEYISPLNGGGHIPTVSHWFVCYTGGEEPTFGSLAVTKEVIPVTATPAVAPPTTYNVTVDCTDDAADTSFPIADGPIVVVYPIAAGVDRARSLKQDSACSPTTPRSRSMAGSPSK